MTEQEIEKAFGEIRELFRETDARLDQRFRETDARLDQHFRETDARLDQHFRETDARLDQHFRETDARLDQHFRETDARLDQRFQETDARLDRRFSETDNKFRRLEGLFTSQWGRLVEALVHPNALKLFRDRGIAVHRVHQRSKAQINGDNMEVDLILENESEVVIVEAKSILHVADIQDLLDTLSKFTHFFPTYKGYRIYGAIASLHVDENADRYAYKQGLFVLGVVGDSMVQILNDEKFKPRDFAPEQRPSDN